MHALINNTQLKAQEEILSLHSSLFSALQTLATWPPQTPNPIYQFRETSTFCLVSPFLNYGCQAVSWDNHGVHFNHPFLNEQCPSLPDVQCLKTVPYILFDFLVVQGGRVNLVSVTLSCLKVEI